MPRTYSTLALLLAILLGFAIRLHNLDTVPLRGDEAFSAMFWAEMPIQQSLSEIAVIEPHPPLTYVIFHIWNLIIGGIDSPFALRMLGIFGNLFGIPAMYALSMRLTKNQIIASVATVMWAIHPFEVWHSQDFRNYALWAGLSVTTIWLGLRLFEHRRHVDWFLYTMSAMLTSFIFYNELFTVVAFGIYILFSQRRDPKFLRRIISLQVFIVLAVLLGFLILQGNLLTGGGYGGNVEPFTASGYLTRFLPTLAIGDTIPIELSNIWIILLIVYSIFTIVVYKTYREIAYFTLLLIGIPLILLGITSTRISIFHPRYVISTVPAFILLLSVGSYCITDHISKYLRVNRNLLTILITLPWFIVSSTTLLNYFNNPALSKSHAWDALGEFLDDNVTENDLVIQLSSDPAFSYYYNGIAESRALPTDPSQPISEIIAELESAQSSYENLYIVSNAISDWQNSDVVETWARENMQAVRLSNASGLGIRQYKNWDVAQTELVQSTTLVSFDEIVELIDYRLFDTPLPTGEIVLWLYWRPISQTETTFKSFIHLVGDINPETDNLLWSQDDQFPQAGRIDSMSWKENSIFRDIYYLPSESLVDGTYEIQLGWYDPQTNTRIQTKDESGSYRLTDLNFKKK